MSDYSRNLICNLIVLAIVLVVVGGCYLVALGNASMR